MCGSHFASEGNDLLVQVDQTDSEHIRIDFDPKLLDVRDVLEVQLDLALNDEQIELHHETFGQVAIELAKVHTQDINHNPNFEFVDVNIALDLVSRLSSYVRKVSSKRAGKP